MTAQLAISGGSSVTEGTLWPRWPVVTPAVRSALEDVAESGVWAISARSNGLPLAARSFETDFARFNQRAWCVTTDHGTSALVTAMEALGIGPGDEVIVPSLTWVACASTVLQVGATPVLVDVDAETLCLDAERIDSAVTARTRLIMVVHLHCTAADMVSISSLAERRGLLVLEDCAQAHGARWRDGRSVGSHAPLATFSFQQSKAMTTGEGGAVVGDDDSLRRVVEVSRADGREVVEQVPGRTEMYLEETGLRIGSNYCLTEFGAAIGAAALADLDAQVKHRSITADLLDTALHEIGVATIKRHPDLEVRPVYEYGVWLDSYPFAQVDPALLRQALAAEIGVPVYAPDAPLHDSPLFRPETKRRFGHPASHYFGSGHAGFQNSERAGRCLAMIHHAAFLAEPDQVLRIAEACAKLIDRVDELRTFAGAE